MYIKIVQCSVYSTLPLPRRHRSEQ